MADALETWQEANDRIISTTITDAGETLNQIQLLIDIRDLNLKDNYFRIRWSKLP